MTEETAGPSIWAGVKPEQLRRLRARAKKAMAEAGTPREMCTNKEADRFLESRNRSTIDRWKSGE